jgi:hypothetical protein
MSSEPTTVATSQALETTTAPKAMEKRPVAMGPNGLQLTDLAQAWRFAEIAAKSLLAPKGMDTPEKVFVAMQLGAELGLGPMAALRAVYVTPGGRPGLYAESAMAICERRGVLADKRTEYSGEGDEFTCTWHYLRAGWKAWKSSSFSIGEAKQAGLVKTDSNWTKYPKRMLLARARGFALHDDFADILLGAPLEGETDEGAAPATATLPAGPAGDVPKPPPPPAMKDSLLDQIIDVEPTAVAATTAVPPAAAAAAPTEPPVHCTGQHTEPSCGAKNCWGAKQSWEDPPPAGEMTHAEADRLIAEEDARREREAAEKPAATAATKTRKAGAAPTSKQDLFGGDR